MGRTGRQELRPAARTHSEHKELSRGKPQVRRRRGNEKDRGKEGSEG